MVVFHRAGPWGLSPPVRRAENKNAVQGSAYTAGEAKCLFMRHRHTGHTNKTTLYKKGRTVV